MKKNKTVWTEDVIEELRVVHTDPAHTLSTIAEHLQKKFPGRLFTRNSVMGKMHRLGFRGHAKRRSTAKKKNWRIKYEEPFIIQPNQPTKTIMELTPNCCRWPLEHPVFGHVYCGEKATKGSYCEQHHKIKERKNYVSTNPAKSRSPKSGRYSGG